jgi:DNA-binding transcriptional regulator LsrR (DeoR family)
MTIADDLLIRIAWQYYIEDRTQQDIAARFNLSRSKVARLLKEARERGIVEFKIKGLPVDHLQLEQELRTYFGLRQVIVIPTPSSSESIRRELARAAAQHVQDLIKPGTIIGLGMGRTLAQIPQYFSPSFSKGCTIVEMVGGSSRTDLGFDTYNVSTRLAELCDGVAHHVNSPVVVQSPEMQAMFVEDPSIKSVLADAARADLALLGIGDISCDMTLARMGYCDQEDVNHLLEKGIVGDVLGRYYDRQGRPVSNDLDQRIIGLSIEQLKCIPNVIGIAGGSSKIPAILGALHSGFLNTMIVDHDTALGVLALEKEATKEKVA